jgi:BspA type Leucine rich repeat region (6 copies)
LSPLQGMPLEEIQLTPKKITRGLDILRGMKSLKTIGIGWKQAWPAAEFWARYDRGEFGAPFTEADEQRIAALPAEQQVEEVRKELVRRNPGFDGELGHKIEDGAVTELRIVADKVSDIAPIRVFNALRRLECSGTATDFKPNGQLADLTPLKGMNLAGLRHLDLRNPGVTDAGMACFKDCKNLTFLNLGDTRVSDAGLAYFKDCKDLWNLHLGNTKVTDKGLAHLKDCKNLRALGLATTRVSDAGLAHFKGCKNLTAVYLARTQVGDAGLETFKDCKDLRDLHLSDTKVTDKGLAHLRGVPLKALAIQHTGITDLTPLRGMPLEKIRLTPKNIARGLDLLRGMKGLKTIGVDWDQVWPAAEFWERYDQGEFE